MTYKVEKTKSLATLIAELDTQISLFVRMNACDGNGTVECISCGEKLWFLDADCCHFKDRQHMGTRFYLPNLAPGCKECNRFNPVEHLNQWEFIMPKEQRWDLEKRSRSLMKWTRGEIQDLILDYRDKVANLRKEKNL